ncbi:uncharacterized protein [Aegilops tauschii subsp. strangulata]|uniref:uncharacterized protein n=1 Tax=Aegilops tauschii subsp. strangulata TaxID=200361 RepID=UPI003CC863B8
MEVKYEEEDTSLMLLCSLPSSYTNFRDTILYSRDTLTRNEVYEALNSKEKMKLMVPHDGSSSSQAEGLSVRGRTKEKNSNNGNIGKSKNGYRGRSQSRDKKYCRYCKRDGHDISECFKLQNKEKRKGSKQGESSTNVARDDSSDDALVVIAGCAETNDEWIEGIGSVRIKMFDGTIRTLTDVRYIPKMKRNLISVSALDAKGYKYSGGDSVLKVTKGSLVVMKVLNKRGLLDGYEPGKLKFCEHCIFGKNKRVKFNTSTHTTEGYKLWNPETQKVVISRNVIFNESAMLHDVPSTNVPVESEQQPIVQEPTVQVDHVIDQVILLRKLKHSSIRTLLSIVAMLDLELEQLDVKTAFLHGELEEDIYMEQPEGFVIPGKEKLVCFKRPNYDSCVYLKIVNGSTIYLLLYVDDMLIVAKSMSDIDELKKQLSNEFEIKDLGAAKKILGMEISRNRPSGKVYLSQKGYIDKVLRRFNMHNAKPSGKTGDGLVGFVDSDFGGDLDKRRSLTGYVFTIGGCAMSWRATLQSIVACSTADAEYMALSEACKEAIWLRGLYAELCGDSSCPTIFSDSQSAIYLTKNPVYHERTKHIDVGFHYIRDVVAEGNLKVCKISTHDNPADKMTKPVPT